MQKGGQKCWKLNYHWKFLYLLVRPQVEFVENLFLIGLEAEYSFPFKILSVLL